MDWKKFKVSDDTSIIEAMRIIDAAGSQLAVVVSENGKLLGTLSDGDIRRGILKGVSTSQPIKVIMNSNPITLTDKSSEAEILQVMRDRAIKHLPIVDSNRNLLKVLSPIDVIEKESATIDNAVVIMAGGLGSRLGSLTADCPKPMLKVGDKPILENIIENLKRFGFRNFFLSVNYKSEMIESHFGDGSNYGVKISYIREKDRMGTAGSLSLYTPINDLPIVVMNGDVLTRVNFTQLLSHHIGKKCPITLAVRQYDMQIPFGVVHIENGVAKSFHEKPTHNFSVNAGIYVINSDVLSAIPQGEYYDMPTLLNGYLKKDQSISCFPIVEEWIDIGREADLALARKLYSKDNK